MKTERLIVEMSACLFKYFCIFGYLNELVLIDHRFFVGCCEINEKGTKQIYRTLESTCYIFVRVYSLVFFELIRHSVGLTFFNFSLLCFVVFFRCSKFTAFNVSARVVGTKKFHLLQTHSSFKRWLNKPIASIAIFEARKAQQSQLESNKATNADKKIKLFRIWSLIYYQSIVQNKLSHYKMATTKNIAQLLENLFLTVCSK